MTAALDSREVEATAQQLIELAKETWGSDRAELLRPMLEQTAEHMVRLRASLPPIREEPAFDVEA